MNPGLVSLVGAGPGDPELITVKGLRALQEADVVLYDSLASPLLLDGLRAERIYVGKRCGVHAMSQSAIHALIVGLAKQGKRVVRLKGGDPFVFGRGGEEALALRQEGVPYEIVPGISSAIAAAAYAGIPITHRGIAESFAVTTAHRRLDEDGFAIPPYDDRTTVVLLMGVKTLPQWAGQLHELGYPGDLPVAFVTWGTTARQSRLVTSVGRCVEDAARHGLASPSIAIIGRTVLLAEQLDWFDPTTAVAPVDEDELAAQ
jgi:uroporphyrinogen III methyltransferase/synthase